MTPEQFSLLLTTARILRDHLDDAVGLAEGNRVFPRTIEMRIDLDDLTDALKPFEPEVEELRRTGT